MQDLEQLGKQFSEITGQSKSYLAVKCALPPCWLPNVLPPLSVLASLPPQPPFSCPPRGLLPFPPIGLGSLSNALNLLWSFSSQHEGLMHVLMVEIQ